MTKPKSKSRPGGSRWPRVRHVEGLPAPKPLYPVREWKDMDEQERDAIRVRLGVSKQED